MYRPVTFAALPVLAAAILVLPACQDQAAGGGAAARDQIRAVGSSTVYPFATLVAEQFVNANPGMKAPVIEATGTGAGMKQFCQAGDAGADIENASRRMKASEFKSCQDAGVGDIVEVQVGIDGIAFAEATNGPKLELSRTDLFKALAANPGGKPNTARTWSDVDPRLPATPIQVYGPPSTSGTRDALAELILAKGCEEVYPEWKTKKASDEDGFKKACTAVREDGVYVDSGENDNLIVQKLQSNPNALGIFGYSYLEENKDKLVGSKLNGIAPTYAAIADGSYPGARPLYIYVKKARLGSVKGLKEYVAQWSAMWNPDGPLTAKGLIAAPDAVRAQNAEIARTSTALNGGELK